MSPEEQRIHDGANGINRWHESERASWAEVVKNQQVEIDRLRRGLELIEESGATYGAGWCIAQARGFRLNLDYDAYPETGMPSPQSGEGQ